MEDGIKKGFLTSEFLVSAVGAVMVIVVGAGLITADQGAEIENLAFDAIVAGFAFYNAAKLLINYASGRAMLKASKMETDAKVLQSIAE